MLYIHLCTFLLIKPWYVSKTYLPYKTHILIQAVQHFEIIPMLYLTLNKWFNKNLRKIYIQKLRNSFICTNVFLKLFIWIFRIKEAWISANSISFVSKWHTLNNHHVVRMLFLRFLKIYCKYWLGKKINKFAKIKCVL